MRLLFLMQGTETKDHCGHHDAFQKMQQEGILEHYSVIPFYGFAREHGWDAFYNKVIDVCRKENITIVYFQYFHGKSIASPVNCINELRRLKEPPLIVTSAGDPFSGNWRPPYYPKSFQVASRMADLTFSTQMGKCADKMVGWGAKNVILMPHSMCQVRFKPSNQVKARNDFDVVFIGSAIKVRNIVSNYYYSAKKRFNMVKQMDKRYGKRFGLFGHNWNGMRSWQGPISFDKQYDTCQRGRLIFGGFPHSVADYYTSNRPFIAAGSGVPLVDLYVPGVEKILRNDEHWYLVTEENILKKIDELLDTDPEALREKAQNTRGYILEKHTNYERMKNMLKICKEYVTTKNQQSFKPSLDYLLPEIDKNREIKYATRLLVK
ncbi:glycosyltransferase [Chitinispirillales bacterium ANBcel5]|uniref:glycosyltransferase family protein n=1 Tax=Cellulosispirillum alkaliphilum TaxID=3039283 RepID=UPI002A588EE5|nr:glycosyltransferase [Chitinispirillales bacterium ANBcel5]